MSEMELNSTDTTQEYTEVEKDSTTEPLKNSTGKKNTKCDITNFDEFSLDLERMWKYVTTHRRSLLNYTQRKVEHSVSLEERLAWITLKNHIQRLSVKKYFL